MGSMNNDNIFLRGLIYKNDRRGATIMLTEMAVLTAIVFVLQMLAGSIPRFFGLFTVTLALAPIVIGSALYGPLAGAWLGLVFGAAVLISGDATPFMQINIFGTLATVLMKGMLAGFAAGLVYRLIEKKNTYVAVFAAALVCPVVNTGVFFLGCVLFFLPTIAEWGAAAGYQNAAAYMFVGLAGFNFLFEVGVNMILAPVLHRVILLINKKMPRRSVRTSTVEEHFNSIPIYKRKIGICILLSFITFGIYLIYWMYLLVKTTRAIKIAKSNCTGEMLCLLFVPFYSLYWWFTRGKLVKDKLAQNEVAIIGNEIAYLILGIFGLTIISMAIMQNDFNSLPTESA